MKWLLKQIVPKNSSGNQNLDIGKAHQVKYKKSGLTQQQAFVIKNKVDEALQEDKLYRNNELGLGELANYIEHDRYKVSEVINTCYAKNFYALLNEYRIKEAKSLLVSNPLLSVKAIMYEVGFNSKNSFYIAFKRETGLCPNDFRTMAKFDYHPQLAS